MEKIYIIEEDNKDREFVTFSAAKAAAATMIKNGVCEQCQISCVIDNRTAAIYIVFYNEEGCLRYSVTSWMPTTVEAYVVYREIEDNGGLDGRMLNTMEKVIEYIKSNYNCTKSVAESVAVYVTINK